jgi:hypothetical protein
MSFAQAYNYNYGPTTSTVFDGSNSNISQGNNDFAGQGMLMSPSFGTFLTYRTQGGQNRAMTVTGGCTVVTTGPTFGGGPGDSTAGGNMCANSVSFNHGSAPTYRICIDCFGKMFLQLVGL